MGLVEKNDIEQCLKSISSNCDPEIAALIREGIESDRLSSADKFVRWLLSKAISNDGSPELCAKLAALVREHLDDNAPCDLICEFMTACQNAFETLLSSLDGDDFGEPHAFERRRRLANLMAFIGHMFRQRAIRGNSIIQSVLNALLGWDQRRSRWQGQPQEYEVSSACTLLSTVGSAYVGENQGSRVYLSRLKGLETAGPWSDTTQRDIAAVIDTWEQEWSSKAPALSESTLLEST
mmetsp:Transcript_132629/g.330817  ORF Transcript_132629/g.330817 Transcript_132629/m.330817 type:complete len:237 (-) Transcript_132629:509-1219(-)